METSSAKSSEKFVVRFWGVRGSIACPGSQTVKYGGNTPCVEMRVQDHLLIFDGGTGIRNLGQSVRNEGNITAHIFLSHLHWDHIQGIPFFEPAFVPGNTLTFYGAQSANGASLEDCLVGQMRDPHFPVPMAGMSARVTFREISAGSSVCVGDVIVRSAPLNHPGGCLGYRVEYKEKACAYITDTELGDQTLEKNVLVLAANADLLIYDAAYTEEEYAAGKKGWGHSTWESAVRVAKQAGVGKLAIFHHDPSHSDDFLDKIALEASRVFENTFVAKEGMSIDLVTGLVEV